MNNFIVVPLVAFVVTLLTTPLVMRLAHRWRVVQPPVRTRDVHRGAVPRMGGAAMVAGFLAAVGVSLVLPVERHNPLEMLHIGGLVVGSLVAMVAGWIDDRWELSPAPQFAIQFLLAGI